MVGGQQLEAVEDATAALPKPEQPAVDVNALVQERTDRESALAAALANRVSFDRLMQQIALVLPADAWLTQLDDESLAHELRGSKQRCEEVLRRPCRTIAYPKGNFDDRVARATAEAGYEAAATLPMWREIDHDHRALLEAIRDGDVDRAMSIAREHIDHVRPEELPTEHRNEPVPGVDNL